MKQIVPNFWFDGQAEAAAAWYADVFGGRVVQTDYYTDEGKEIHGHNAGEVMTVTFEIGGQRFVGLNGGPQFSITPAISFFVTCADEQELDGLWAQLSDGGTVLMPVDAYPFSKRYGWVSDSFGVSWQLILAEGPIQQKITTSLLFSGDNYGKAAEALALYTAVFPDSEVGLISRYGEGQEPNDANAVAYGEATILGQKVSAMDSALEHAFTFTEGVSLMIECDTQEEIDRYWQGLSANPEAEACGWLQDKYGVSWQITPRILNDMLHEGTPEQVKAVTASFMAMKKMDIAALEQAYRS